MISATKAQMIRASFLLILFALHFCGHVFSQLTAGDVAFVAYDGYYGPGGQNEPWAWVALTDIPANTTVTFTDSSVLSSGIFSGESGGIRWVSSSTLPAGSVVRWTGSNWSFGSANNTQSNATGLNNTGDNLFAALGEVNFRQTGLSVSDVQFLGGIAFGTGGWITSGTGDSSKSYIPVNSLGVNISSFGNTATYVNPSINGFYSGPSSATNKEGWLARLNSPSNWTTQTQNAAIANGPLSTSLWPTSFAVAQSTLSPVISNVTPNPVTGSVNQQLFTIFGRNFTPGSKVQVGYAGNNYTFVNTNTAATYVSSIQLTVPITTSTTADTWKVRVVNPDGEASAEVSLTVNSSNGNSPVLSSLSPTQMVGSTTTQTLTLNGSNFAGGCKVQVAYSSNNYNFVNTNVNPTLVSSSKLTVPIITSKTPDTWSVRVINSDGQMSNAVGLTVSANAIPAPILGSLNPNPVIGSTSAQQFTLTGSNFVNGAKVQVAYASNNYTFVNTNTEAVFLDVSQLSVPVTTSLQGDTWKVRVVNPDGQISGSVNLTVHAPTGTSSISGFLTDSETGSPLPNVTVSVGGSSQITNSSGRYSISGLASGAYNLAAGLLGYTTYSSTISVSGIVTKNVQLQSNLSTNPSATLAGRVSDASTNRALSGVTVYLVNTSSQIVQSNATTNGSGNYSFTSFPSGYYTVRVVVNSYQTYNRTQQLAGSASLQISLSPATAFLGSTTPSPMSADPVNTATGNYIYSHVDLKIPATGLPLVFERNYNSQSGAAGTNGPLGYGWNHNYNVRLTTDDAGNVTVHWGDSKTDTYTANGPGAFTPQPGFAIFDTFASVPGGGYTLKKKDLTVYTFNAAKLLTTISDKNGNAVQLAYSGANLASITSASGRVLALSYDSSNLISQITDPIDRTIRFDYDNNGNLTSVTDANGHITTYTYNASHEMLTAVDPRGNAFVTNVYDDTNRVVNSQKDAKGGQTTFLYDPENGKTTVTLPLGRVTVDHYDTFQRLTKQDDALGNFTKYGYDEEGNRVFVSDKIGNTVTYAYDASGNVTGKTDALGKNTLITYDAKNNPLSRTDQLGGITQFEYDTTGNLIKTTDALGAITSLTYDSSGRLLTITDPLLNTTTSAYDVQGNLTSTTDSLNNVTTYSYDAAGRRSTTKDALNRITTLAYDNNDNVLTITDPATKIVTSTYDGNNNRLTARDKRGKTTSYVYDVKDLLSTTTDPLGGVVSNTYDALDQKLSTTDARGGKTQYFYDLVGNLISVTDALGKVTRYTYDANGNRLTIKNPLDQTTTFTYDALDRLVQTTDAIGNTTKTEYDAMGRRTKVIDANSKATTFLYDAQGHLAKATDANGGTVIYAYDAAGNRTSMIDPNNHITTYTYDKLNRLTQMKDPSNGIYLNSYDAVGNLVSRKDAKNQTITYTYDPLNRSTGIAYPSGAPVTFSYDANGNRTAMSDSLGSSSYVYDDLNRMTSTTDSYGKTVGYGYDANGNRVIMSYPGNKIVSYTYDAVNRLKTVTDWLPKVTTYSYDDAGNLLGNANPNGTTVAYAYDTAGRLTSLANAKADTTIISNYRLTLDPVGNHTRVTQNEPLPPVIPAQTINYAYDSDNRLTTAGATTCTYDANGNLTARGIDTFSYDFENRLTQSTIGGVISQYQYDGTGNRKATVTAGVTKRFVLDINGSLSHVLADTDASGSVNAYYLYGRGLVSRISFNGTPLNYHYDVRGSTIALSDASGNLIDQYAYDPFGKIANNHGATANPFKYVGKYGVMDEGNGLAYIRARYFSPDFGRFITKDPTIGSESDSQSLNRYVYGLNNPISRIDISGYSSKEIGQHVGNQILSTDINPIHSYLAEGGKISPQSPRLIDVVAGDVSSLGLKAVDVVFGTDGIISSSFGYLSKIKSIFTFGNVAKDVLDNTPIKVRNRIDILTDPNSSDADLDAAQNGFYKDLYTDPGLRLIKSGSSVVGGVNP